MSHATMGVRMFDRDVAHFGGPKGGDPRFLAKSGLCRICATGKPYLADWMTSQTPSAQTLEDISWARYGLPKVLKVYDLKRNPTMACLWWKRGALTRPSKLSGAHTGGCERVSRRCCRGLAAVSTTLLCSACVFTRSSWGRREWRARY